MNVFVLVLGLMTGEVSAVEAEQYLSAQPVQTIAYAASTDTRQMTDDQLEQVYMTPEGWDAASWAAAVRTINLNVPAGRLLRY